MMVVLNIWSPLSTTVYKSSVSIESPYHVCLDERGVCTKFYAKKSSATHVNIYCVSSITDAFYSIESPIFVTVFVTSDCCLSSGCADLYIAEIL